MDGLLGAALHLQRRILCLRTKQAQVFLTNQSATVYKLLANLAAQQMSQKGHQLAKHTDDWNGCVHEGSDRSEAICNAWSVSFLEWHATEIMWKNSGSGRSHTPWCMWFFHRSRIHKTKHYSHASSAQLTMKQSWRLSSRRRWWAHLFSSHSAGKWSRVCF